MVRKALIRLAFVLAPRAGINMVAAGGAIGYGSHFVDLRGQLPVRADVHYYMRDPSTINGVILHHTASSDKASWKSIADYHTSYRKWPEIGYQFGIDKEGVVYQFMDYAKWSNHAQGYNKHTVGVVLLGDYQINEVSPAMLESLTELMAYFKDEFKFKYMWLHRDTKKTLCPGDCAEDVVRPLQWGPPPPSKK